MSRAPNRLSPSQRRVLEHIKGPRHFSYGGENHWYFNGEGGFRVHANTGRALRDAGYIKALPRLKEQPFWRTDYDLTTKGRQMLTRAEAAS